MLYERSWRPRGSTLEIDETNILVKKVKVQATGGNQKYVYLPAVLDENGLDVHVGDSIELCMDKKNKVVFFHYGKSTCRNSDAGDHPGGGTIGGALSECWEKRDQVTTRKSREKSR